MRKRTLSIALGLMAALLFSSGANALPINPSNSGLSFGFGYGELGFNILYEVNGSGAVSGECVPRFVANKPSDARHDPRPR